MTAHEDMEVMDGRRTAEVEEVLGFTAVAGAAALPTADVGQGVLDRDAFAELGAAGGALLALAQLAEERFVGMDGDAPAPGAGGAAVPLGAGGAGLGREVAHAARPEG